MATWTDVENIAMSLPEVTEEPCYGARSWRVRKRLFVWERPLRDGDLEALGDRAPTGDVLAARTSDLEMKDVLLAHDPRAFFTIPHFDGYAAVLVRLERISAKELRALIVDAWFSQAPKRLAQAFLESR